jgi:hypothetical protein
MGLRRRNYAPKAGKVNVFAGRATVIFSATTITADLPSLRPRRFVSGHGFSRAERGSKKTGFSRCFRREYDAAPEGAMTEDACGTPEGMP